MPDIRARSWFIRIARMFSKHISPNDILQHSRLIGFANPNQLLGCICDNGTETARKIVRNLYSKEELISKSGTQVVSEQKRKVIRGKWQS